MCKLVAFLFFFIPNPVLGAIWGVVNFFWVPRDQKTGICERRMSCLALGGGKISLLGHALKDSHIFLLFLLSLPFSLRVRQYGTILQMRRGKPYRGVHEVKTHPTRRGTLSRLPITTNIAFPTPHTPSTHKAQYPSYP